MASKYKPKFSEDIIYYMTDIKKKIYDPKPIKGWKAAVRLNMTLQMSGYGDYIIPMDMKGIKLQKFKRGKIFEK